MTNDRRVPTQPDCLRSAEIIRGGGDTCENLRRSIREELRDCARRCRRAKRPGLTHGRADLQGAATMTCSAIGQEVCFSSRWQAILQTASAESRSEPAPQKIQTSSGQLRGVPRSFVASRRHPRCRKSLQQDEHFTLSYPDSPRFRRGLCGSVPDEMCVLSTRGQGASNFVGGVW